MNLDLWPILSHYGWQLPTKRGVWQTIRCEAHDDSHKSCRINSELGKVMCLACGFPSDGRSGNPIDVIRFYEGISEFVDVVKRYEEITGGSSNLLQSSGRSRGNIPRRQGDHARNREPQNDRLLRRTARGA